MHGAVGKAHLLEMARQILSAPLPVEWDQAAWDNLGRGVAISAWEHDMMDGALATQLAPLCADGGLASLLRAVAEHHKVPERLDYLMRLLGKRETDKAFAYIKDQAGKAPKNLFWLHQAFGLAVYEKRFDIARELLLGARQAMPDSLSPLLDKLEGDLAWFSGELDIAADRYARASAAGGMLMPLLGLAEICILQGREAQAVELLRGVLEEYPWNSNLLLKLHDLVQGVARESSLPPNVSNGRARVAVLLYTWNKERELEQALSCLADSLATAPSGAVQLVVLNNGCTDGTAAVLDSWQARLVADVMEVVTLPVNVGAPAARNWLMRHPAVTGAEWVIYMDDDALPPMDWMGRLGAAARRYPDAGVWGCRILDAGNPLLVQKADMFLRPPRAQVSQEAIAPEYARRFSFSNIHSQVLDAGQFSYLRPCGLVTGCLHMFRREVLESVGGFDLRFNPSQYDDVAHDIRLGLHGVFPVYQGHLGVRHLQLSGKAKPIGDGKTKSLDTDPSPEAPLASALGNLYKLQMLYSEEQITSLRNTMRKRLLEDIEEKQDALTGCAG